jgi:RNA binding exosome subunit
VLFCGLVLILGSWLSIAWLVSCPRVVAKSLVLLRLVSFATELVSSVMVELGYTQAVDVTLVADSQDNRKGHYGEDNNIYLNDTNLNNTKERLHRFCGVYLLH